MMGLRLADDCRKCDRRVACSQVVWGASEQGAGVLVVAEYPGKEDDLLGEPLSDRDGFHVLRLLEKVGLKAHRTLAVKCAGEKPTDDQANACRGWLWRELRELRPKVVLTLGALPARMLLRLKKSFRLGDFAGGIYKVGYMDAAVAPWYAAGKVYKNLVEASEAASAFFHRVKEFLDAEVAEAGGAGQV